MSADVARFKGEVATLNASMAELVWCQCPCTFDICRQICVYALWLFCCVAGCMAVLKRFKATLVIRIY